MPSALRAASCAIGRYSKDSPRKGLLSPARTSASKPSTSILQKAGAPWVAMRSSRVTTSTPTERPQRTLAKRWSAAVADSIHSDDIDDTVGVALDRASRAWPGRAPTALGTVDTP